MPASAFESALGAGSADGAGEFDDEAQPAFPPAGSAPGAGGDEGGPSLEELEAQMGGELSAREDTPVSPSGRRAAAPTDDDDGEGRAVALPEVEALVARLPAEVRDTLDELFRARFVAVKKLPKKLLQPAKTKRASSAAEGSSP